MDRVVVLQVHTEMLEVVVPILHLIIIVAVAAVEPVLQGILVMVVMDCLLLMVILVFHQIMVRQDQIREDILLVVEQEPMELIRLYTLDLLAQVVVDLHMVDQGLSILAAAALEIWQEEPIMVVPVLQEL